MDVRNLALSYDFDFMELRAAIETVAKSRGVELTSFREAIDGWAEAGQTKWSAWRSRQGIEAITLADFGAQLEVVTDFIDPVFVNDSSAAPWDHVSRRWVDVPAV